MDSITGDVTTAGQVLGRWSVGARSVLVAVSVLLLTVFLMFLRRPKRLPPGPKSWPVIGCLPLIARAVLIDKQLPHEFLSKLSERYGDVVSLYLAGKLVVVVSKSATMRAAFGLQQLSSRPEFHVANEEFPGRGVFAASGPTWVELRRFSLRVLRGLGVGKSSFEENISAEVKYLTDKLREDHGAPVDLRLPLNNALSNVICAVVFGKRFEYGDKMFQNLLTYTSDMTREAGPGLFAEFLPAALVKLRVFGFVRNYIRAIRNFYGHIGALVKEHEAICDTEEPRDFIDEFVKACETREKQGVASPGLTSGNLLRSVGDLFIGGAETSATTLRWGVLYMMAYPDIQTRIQQDLDAVTGRNRLPVLSDKAKLSYTEATLCEIQRISTILPLSAPHYCAEKTAVNGYNIPKGAYVLANLWHSHFDPSLWAEPREFRPERFLDEFGKLRHRDAFVPFGNGRRSCLGENLAKMELFVFFTHLLHHFTFKKPTDAPPISFSGILGITWSPVDFTACAISRE